MPRLCRTMIFSALWTLALMGALLMTVAALKLLGTLVAAAN